MKGISAVAATFVSIICKGPKYRFSSQIDFNTYRKKSLIPYKNFVIDGTSENVLNLML